MKAGTKKLIIATVDEKIRSYETSIEHCKSSGFDRVAHIQKLELKKDRLQQAIVELKEETR